MRAPDEKTESLACADHLHASLNQSQQETAGLCRTELLNPRLPPKPATRTAAPKAGVRARWLGFLPLAMTVLEGMPCST
jgi:hypothetical protein